MIIRAPFEVVERFMQFEILNHNMAKDSAEYLELSDAAMDALNVLHYRAVKRILIAAAWTIEEYRSEMRKRAHRPEDN